MQSKDYIERITVPLHQILGRTSAASIIERLAPKGPTLPSYYLRATEEAAGGKGKILFRFCRTGPARDIDYSQCVQGYDRLDEDEQACAQTAVDELFLHEEAKALQLHMGERYAMALDICQIDLPLPPNVMGATCVPLGGVYGQAAFEPEDEKALGFSFVACYQRREDNTRPAPARLPIFMSRKMQALLDELGKRYMQSLGKERDCVK